MQKPKRDSKPAPVVSDAVLREFVGEGFPPVEVAKDGMVAVTMNSRFQLTLVSIQNVGLKPGVAGRLEQAIQKAVNEAFFEVGKRNGERLMAAMAEPSPRGSGQA